MSDYDLSTTRTYVENGGGYCPECDHDEPNTSRPRVVDDMISIDYECPRCRAQWESLYILDNVQQLRAGKHANQHQLFAVGGT